MSDAVQDLLEPIGRDPAVQEAVETLRRAMIEACREAGHDMRTLAIAWATDRGGDCYGGCLLSGDASDDVIEFLAGVLLDDSDDVELTEMTRRIN